MSTDFYSFEMDDEVEPECTGEQNALSCGDDSDD